MKSETICRASVLREKRKMGNGRRNYKLRGISVQFSSSVMSNSSWSHAPQHARPRCPSPTPRVYPNPCRSSQWCHPTISSFAVPFSSCPQSVPAPTRVFSNESALRIRWPKYWSFSFNISPELYWKPILNCVPVIVLTQEISDKSLEYSRFEQSSLTK